MTHWRSPVLKPRSAWAVGSAMFTTVASSTTISWASATTASVHQRRGDGGATESPARFEDMTTTIYGTVEFRNHRVSEPAGSRTTAYHRGQTGKGSEPQWR